MMNRTNDQQLYKNQQELLKDQQKMYFNKQIGIAHNENLQKPPLKKQIIPNSQPSHSQQLSNQQQYYNSVNDPNSIKFWQKNINAENQQQYLANPNINQSNAIYLTQQLKNSGQFGFGVNSSFRTNQFPDSGNKNTIQNQISNQKQITGAKVKQNKQNKKSSPATTPSSSSSSKSNDTSESESVSSKSHSTKRAYNKDETISEQDSSPASIKIRSINSPFINQDQEHQELFSLVKELGQINQEIDDLDGYLSTRFKFYNSTPDEALIQDRVKRHKARQAQLQQEIQRKFKEVRSKSSNARASDRQCTQELISYNKKMLFGDNGISFKFSNLGHFQKEEQKEGSDESIKEIIEIETTTVGKKKEREKKKKSIKRKHHKRSVSDNLLLSIKKPQAKQMQPALQVKEDLALINKSQTPFLNDMQKQTVTGNLSIQNQLEHLKNQMIESDSKFATGFDFSFQPSILMK